jgi:fructose-1,6-bisphosphatase/inositol monophosphatase family enzyme
MSVDLDQLSKTLAEIAETIILPRFRSLSNEDIEEKAKGDFVTVADREAEEALSPILKDLVPGSIVVGEEATAAKPSLLKEVKAEGPIWFVDPIDGTAQFVKGDPDFAIMVALAEKGEVQQSAIYFPVSRDLYLAESNAGATWSDKSGKTSRLKLTDDIEDISRAKTVMFTRHFPSAWDARLSQIRDAVTESRNTRPSACQYTELAKGQNDLVVYHRMLPWDHAPGSLILCEAGGLSRNLETGENYRPETLGGPHLLSTSETLWEQVQKLVG